MIFCISSIANLTNLAVSGVSGDNTPSVLQSTQVGLKILSSAGAILLAVEVVSQLSSFRPYAQFHSDNRESLYLKGAFASGISYSLDAA